MIPLYFQRSAIYGSAIYGLYNDLEKFGNGANNRKWFLTQIQLNKLRK